MLPQWKKPFFLCRAFWAFRPTSLRMSLNSLIVVRSIKRTSLNVNPKVRLKDQISFWIFAHIVFMFVQKQKYYMSGKLSNLSNFPFFILSFSIFLSDSSIYV